MHHNAVVSSRFNNADAQRVGGRRKIQKTSRQALGGFDQVDSTPLSMARALIDCAAVMVGVETQPIPA